MISPLVILLSYQGSFNRGKMNVFLYLKILACIVIIRIIEK